MKYLCRECGNKYFTPECSNGCKKSWGIKEIENDTDYNDVVFLLQGAMAELDLYVAGDMKAMKELTEPMKKVYKAWSMLMDADKPCLDNTTK